MKKIISICCVLGFLCMVGCGNDCKQSAVSEYDNEMSMSEILVENSSFIERVAVFQDGTRTEVALGDIGETVSDTFEVLIKNQKNMGAVDSSLDASAGLVEQYLLNEDIIQSEDIEAAQDVDFQFVTQLDISKQYILIEFTQPHTFVLEDGYAIIDCESFLVDREEKLVHWSRNGTFIGTAGYF